MRTQTTRVIAGRVNLDGSPWTGSGFTSRRTALGNYTVTFPGSRLLSFVATPFFGGGGAFIVPSAYTEQSASVTTANTSGGSVDTSFQFTATVAA